jgi:heme a synthase
MVESGLSNEILTTPGAVPRVSQYRLAAHLGAALTLYIGMFATAVGVSRDWKYATGNGKLGGLATDGMEKVVNNPAVRRFKGLAGVVGGLVLLTAVSGEWYCLLTIALSGEIEGISLLYRCVRRRTGCWTRLQ